MDISLLIRSRLYEMGLDQKDLAAAAEVTESYISQLLARKKAPPAPTRTDIYEKIGAILNLPPGELSNLAELQRKEELRKRITEPPRALFEERRELLIGKCNPASEAEVRRIFEKEAFGELERLVTQTLVKASADLATIDEWDIDLNTFSIEVVVHGDVKRFHFIEITPDEPAVIERGLEQFLADKSLSGDATEDEISFLRALRFKGKRPSAIYYYRELQNLRDPLHFH
jgi:transcriptional regulator with XRE-family HTH domain